MSILVLFIGIASVSTASIFIRFAQKDVPSLVIAFYRIVLATIALAPFVFTRYIGELRSLNRKQLSLHVLSGIFLALHFACWITSLELTSVISSVVLVTTSPLWVALVSPLVLKERVKLLLLIGLAISLSGGIVVSIGQVCSLQAGIISCSSPGLFIHGENFLGILLALIGSWFAAGYVIIGRRLRPTISLLPYTFLVYGSSAAFLFVAVGITGQPLIGYSPRMYLLFIALALIPQLIGHSSFIWAMRYLSATYISVALLGEPVGSSILAYFLLNEVPSSLELAGGVLILMGIFLATRSEHSSGSG